MIATLLGAAGIGSRRAGGRAADLGALSLVMFLVVIAMSSVWHAVLGGPGRTLGGYDWRALVWYVVFAEASTVPVRRIVETVGDHIGSGDVQVAMLRPVSVAGLSMALEAGGTLVGQCVCLITGAALAVILVGAPPAWQHLGLALVATPVAMLLNLSLQYALGAVAFWARDARATWFLYQKLILIGGGVLIPLDLLPSRVAAVLEALPFAAVAYIPGRLAAGRGDARLIAYQVCWLGVAMAAALILFARGQRRLEVVGG